MVVARRQVVGWEMVIIVGSILVQIIRVGIFEVRCGMRREGRSQPRFVVYDVSQRDAVE
jgi:hypothetical protein